jgi:hypothetical protein
VVRVDVAVVYNELAFLTRPLDDSTRSKSAGLQRLALTPSAGRPTENPPSPACVQHKMVLVPCTRRASYRLLSSRPRGGTRLYSSSSDYNKPYYLTTPIFYPNSGMVMVPLTLPRPDLHSSASYWSPLYIGDSGYLFQTCKACPAR